MPVGNQATAVAYAQMEEPEAEPVPAPQAQPQLVRPPAQPHKLFTAEAVEEPAPQRSSLFGKVTGAWRRAPVTAPAPEFPDMRRLDARPVQAHAEPTALVRPVLSEADNSGLDIPAFLRRQSS
jgi:hypothetical protein